MRSSIASWSIWGYLPVAAALAVVWSHSLANAQSQAGAPLKLDTGEEIFKAACIGCHGPNGKGQPISTLGFEPPKTFPDFTDCNGSTRERAFDWKATIHEGGHGRGFNEIMPSFAEALTNEQIDMVIQYLRSQCTEPGWPLGELNMPRAMATEKAFPEDETVLTTTVNANQAAGVSPVITYEKRIGVKNQLELTVPFSFQKQNTGTWFAGPGDLVLGFKRVIAHSSKTGSIFSVQGEVNVPTGNADHGLGNGVTVFETFGSFGQRLPPKARALSFVQTMIGAELPTHTKDAPQAVFWRTAIGKTFAQNKGFGRTWTPMLEFLSDRELVDGAKTNWDILPQIQVSLNKRQHILASVGVQVPMNNTMGRATQVVFYLLWDWFDGGLRDGWK
ncbi:MAG TPA: cytochrome c [Bryobacteraceae bacterium]|nr:cytochrome c [Bryobacteraceae bacterium]